MKKAVALVTCLMTLGPAVGMADHYQKTKVVIKEHNGTRIEKRVVTRVVEVKEPRRKGKKKHKDYYNLPVYGRVIDVEPVYHVTTYHEPVDSCLRYRNEGHSRVSATPVVLGAIIGGALGHSIGDSHGDPDAAAIAGGLLGASIGHNVGQHMRDSQRLVVSGPCVPGEREVTRREVVEYVVSYRYNGAVYKTRMDYDPGEWVALDVDVKPA